MAREKDNVLSEPLQQSNMSDETPSGERRLSRQDSAMDVNSIDMGSLTISDFTDAVSVCESGVELDFVNNVITSQAHIASHEARDRADDSRNHCGVLPSPATHNRSVDEGYLSHSVPIISGRFPIQETDNSTVNTQSITDCLTVYSQDQDGDTDLHTGIIQGETSVVMWFISLALNSEWLNLCNKLLQTPLHLAVIMRQGSVVRSLMTAGARCDVVDIHGNTPLHIACREGYDDIVNILLTPVYYQETLRNKYEIPYQRIPQNVEKRNYQGHTCLHLAAMATHLKVLDLLLSKGADINARDGTSGRTILHYAADTGNRILLRYLLSQRHLDVSCKTYGGLTPLRLAAGRGYGDVVSILLASGADVTDIDGTSDSSDDDFFNDFHINGQPIFA